MTRNGKIARLPVGVREELNRRLQNGEMGTRLLVWLNSHPEVQRVLAAEFGGQPISSANLTAWKAGGYQDWLAEQAALAQAKEWTALAKEWAVSTEERYADSLSTLLAARYAQTLADWKAGEIEPFRRKRRALRPMLEDILKLRRGDQNGVRLVMEKAEREFKEEKKADQDFRSF